MVTCSGSLATNNCELRQVRKEATAAVNSGAGCGWGGSPPYFFSIQGE